MAFCMNCGKQLPEGAKFCLECGTKLGDVMAEQTPKRETTYEGEIHKCPNCGEVLDSFVTVCPACSYELRGSSAASAIKEFSAKLNSATTEYQKANIIRSFPIPNTKEDIFEFMILVSSNIDEHPNKGVFEAWIAKFEQCYEKAKLSFKQDNDFVKIQAIYERTSKEIKAIRRKGPLKKILLIVVPIILIIGLNIAFWSWVFAPDPKGEAKEVERLEAIVVEVENALRNEEFDLAMMHAKSIDYSAFKANDELERQWDIKRDYLIKQIIEEAAKKGIEMEYPTDTADEKDRQSSSSYDYEKSKEEIQNNIDEFNKYMDEIEDMWNQQTENEPTN